MPRHLKILIETESIANSNPAVVSRIPIICLEDKDIHVKEIWNNYVKHSLTPFFKIN